MQDKRLWMMKDRELSCLKNDESLYKPLGQYHVPSDLVPVSLIEGRGRNARNILSASRRRVLRYMLHLWELYNLALSSKPLITEAVTV